MTPQVLDLGRRHVHRMVGFVVEVGAYDENGSIRDVLPVSIGVDMRSGPRVDLVMPVEGLVSHFGPESADAVVCCESLEHMEDWDAALTNLWGVLREGGTLLLTLASPSKRWHGYPGDYWRITREDLRRVFAGNVIHEELPDGLCSVGLVATKTGPLDMTVRPYEVKR